MAQIFSSAAAKVAPVPSIFSRLSRAVAPATRLTSRGGTPSALATSLISAALASPSLAAARTRTLSTQRPSASCSIPSMASRPPLGVSRTASATPSCETVQGLLPSLATASGERPDQTREDDALDEDDDQDDDDGRDVDAAQVGQPLPDRPQHRLGDAIEEFRHHGDELVARVDHVEGDQPAHDGGRNQNIDVERQHIGNENDQIGDEVSGHLANPGARGRLTCTVPAPGRQACGRLPPPPSAAKNKVPTAP